jgi:hypothetical protein
VGGTRFHYGDSSFTAPQWKTLTPPLDSTSLDSTSLDSTSLDSTSLDNRNSA